MKVDLVPPRSTRRPSLPLTSLIDVVFLLLIFFMLTATFTPDEGRIDAGLAVEGRGDAAEDDLVPQIIEVAGGPAGDVFTIGGRVPASQRELTDILRGLPKAPGVVIRVRDSATIAGVAAAEQAVADAGFTRRTYVPASDD